MELERYNEFLWKMSDVNTNVTEVKKEIIKIEEELSLIDKKYGSDLYVKDEVIYENLHELRKALMNSFVLFCSLERRTDHITEY